MLRLLSAAFLLIAVVVVAAPSTAQAAGNGEPGWLGVVVARGELKQEIESTPILDRPNRPFHFYGNTVRRKYYRGSPVPRPVDVAQGGAALVVKRRPDAQTQAQLGAADGEVLSQ
jgi:hypothetical protein